jgi:cytochrome c peroxidase
MTGIPARLSGASAVAIIVVGSACAPSESPLTPLERLGKALFFDQQLSLRANQSCASCHAPEAGWTGGESGVNAGPAVYEGSVAGRYNNRKPPSAAYAMAPVLHITMDGETLFVGGNFWDGHATGRKLGDPIADQAQGPLLNPVEQALPDAGCVVWKACTGAYAAQLDARFPGCDIPWPPDVAAACASPGHALRLSAAVRAKSDRVFDRIARAIAAYERSREVNPFSAKFDRYLAGDAALTDEERAGLDLFVGRGECAECHVLDDSPDGRPPLLTDFTFDNLGVPRNPENPWYRSATNPSGSAWVDDGLGGFLGTRAEWAALAAVNRGKHKVPTLRNVDLRPSRSFVKAYMHNGYFKTLEGVVHFYNTRDVKPVCSEPLPEHEAMARGCWPAAEVADNVNTEELGNLGLTPAEEAAIVAFMQTLSDGYAPPVPRLGFLSPAGPHRRDRRSRTATAMTPVWHSLRSP